MTHAFVRGFAAGAATFVLLFVGWLGALEWGVFHHATTARRDITRARARHVADGKDASGKVASQQARHPGTETGPPKVAS